MLRGSDRGFALETTSNPITGWIRTRLAGRLAGPLAQLEPVRAAIFNLFSQTWISYRHSPAIADERVRGRGPRPGDRAPYGHFESTPGHASLFDVCGGTRHHLLLFEGPTAAPSGPARRHAIRSLLSQYAVDVSVHDVPACETSLHDRYGAHPPALVFLIRPDGHIAYSGTSEDLGKLRTYLNRIYVRVGQDNRT